MVNDPLDDFPAWEEALQADLRGNGRGDLIDDRSVAGVFFDERCDPIDAAISIESYCGDCAG